MGFAYISMLCGSDCMATIYRVLQKKRNPISFEFLQEMIEFESTSGRKIVLSDGIHYIYLNFGISLRFQFIVGMRFFTHPA